MNASFLESGFFHRTTRDVDAVVERSSRPLFTLIAKFLREAPISLQFFFSRFKSYSETFSASKTIKGTADFIVRLVRLPF